MLQRVDFPSEVDLLLCDINMPRMSGLELLDHLESGERDSKVVMITAYSDMANIRNAMNHGAFDFIVKPLDFTELLMTMKRAIDQLYQERLMQSQRDAAEAARRALSRYFPAHRMNEVLASREIFATPHEENAAVMFVDLAGFTRLSHLCTSLEVFAFLRDFQGHLANLVFEHGGHVDKYLGDGLMAVFSTVVDKSSHSGAALSCGRHMLKVIDDFFANHPMGTKAEDSVALGEMQEHEIRGISTGPLRIVPIAG